jgi:hypothetical protein
VWTRIRYSHLLVHLIGGDLAGSVEEGEDSSSRRFHGVVGLVQSTYFTILVLEASDRFKGSTTTISALGRWSLGGTCTKTFRLSSTMSGRLWYGNGDSGMLPAVLVVVRWSKDVNIIFIMFCLVLLMNS